MIATARLLAVALLLAVPGAAPVLAGDVASPVGQWEVSTGESRYRISYCGDEQELCAVLTWLREDARTKNNVALLNDYVVRGAEHDGGASWKGEVTFDGNTYDASMTMVSDDVMKVNSCAGLLCQSYELRRR
jgi:uncharacterized protein (DUF2147 family)